MNFKWLALMRNGFGRKIGIEMTLPDSEPRFDDDIIIAKYLHKTPADIFEQNKRKYVDVLMIFILIGSLCVLYSLL